MTTDVAAEMRDQARQIFDHALREASIDRTFARHVQCDRGVLRVCEDLYDLNSYGRLFVVSIGKAAHSMVEALIAQAGERFEGIVASSTAPAAQLRGFRYFQSGHPTPNADSVRAAEATLKSLQAQTAASLVIFLLSGGGSSMMEKPVDDEISLDDLVATYRALVHSSAAIAEINTIRKHISSVKGGRLAQAAYPAQQVSLLVSDVPDNTPDALASGPTMPDSTSAEDCYAIVARHNLLPDFPASVRELFERRALDETPNSDDPAFVRARWWTISSNAALLEAAKAEAEQMGFAVTIDNSCDDWEYSQAADYLLRKLRELRQRAGKVCLLSGGEVTVKVTNGGTGGRNQQFALDCASKTGRENITVLSAGSDGIDGNSQFAGAVADGTTLNRAAALSLNAENHLNAFNASPFFDTLGDTIFTGPTGNNLRDLRILLAY
jgi:hydroxypyruvate reductase